MSDDGPLDIELDPSIAQSELDIELDPSVVKAKPKSLPKQAVASLMDLPADVLSIPPMLRILPTAAARYMTSPDTFVESLGKTMDKAFDYEKALINTSNRMRQFNNELLGIDEPQDISEILARSIPGALLPIPIKAATVPGKVAQFLAPGFQAAKSLPYPVRGGRHMLHDLIETAQKHNLTIAEILEANKKGGTYLNKGNVVRALANAGVTGGADVGLHSAIQDQATSQLDIEPNPSAAVGITDRVLDIVEQLESGGDIGATSPKGAEGNFQVMPTTAKQPGFGVAPLTDTRDPQESRRFARDYLQAMLARYDGNIDHALMAYNWGPGSVDNWLRSGANPADVPAETRQYVNNFHAANQVAQTPDGAIVAGSSELLGQPKSDQLLNIELNPVPNIELNPGIMRSPSQQVAPASEAVLDLDARLEEERRQRVLTKVSVGLGVAAATIGALYGKSKYNAYKAMQSRELGVLGLRSDAEGSWRTTLKDLEMALRSNTPGEDSLPSGGAWAKGQMVDANEYSRALLKSITIEDVDPTTGVPNGNLRKLSDAEIESYISASTVDSFGMAMQAARDGWFGQGTGIKSEVPLMVLARRYQAMSRELKDTVDLGITAHREIATRARSAIRAIAESGGTEARQLWKNKASIDDMIDYLHRHDFDPRRVGITYFDWDALKEARLRMLRDPNALKWAEDFGKTMDDIAEYMYRRDLISKKMLDDARAHNTIGGLRLFVPGMDIPTAPKTGFTMKMLNSLGIRDMKADVDVMSMGHWFPRSLEAYGGIKDPINPLIAAQNYLARVIEHANRNNEARNLLFRATGLNSDGVLSPNKLTKNTGGVEFIGKTDLDAPGKSLWEIAYKSDLSMGAKRVLGAVEESPRAATQSLDETKVVTVTHKGVQHHFFVPDEVLRNVIQTKPQILGILNQVGRLLKNTVQRWTTGTSLFAPIAGIMNYQMIRANSIARGVHFNIADLARGLIENAGYRLSTGLSEVMANAITNNTTLNKIAPAMVQDLAAYFKTRMDNSIFAMIQREVGTLSTPFSVQKLDSRLIDLAKGAAPLLGHNTISLHSLGRFLDGFKRVMHEAPVTGLILKNIKESRLGGELTPRDVRVATHRAMDIAGDVRRHGASPVSAAFHAWVPWSGPFVQGIGSTAEAMHSAVKSGSPHRLALAAGAVMTPMAGALIWNQFVGDEYADYYWSKLTDVQRVNNIYLAIPGLPPENGLLIPLDPLWSLFNSVTIEMMDAAFGLSRTRLYRGVVPHSGQSGINGAHLIEGVGRYFDIPVPPALQAVWAANFGKSLSWRPMINDKGVFSFGEERDISQTAKYDVTTSSRQVDSGVSAVVEGVLRSLFGVGAEVVLSAYAAGSQGFASGGAMQGMEFAASATTDALARQARYMQPLFPGMLRSNETSELDQMAKWKSNGILAMEKTFQQNVPGVYTMNGAQVMVGNSKQMLQDPVMKHVSGYIEAAKFEKSQYDGLTERLRRQLTDLRSTGTYRGQPITYNQRKELLEEKSMQIRSLTARYVTALQNIEDAVNSSGQAKFGRDIDFKFESYQPRPNLGTGAFLPARRG